jgi:hypothetical protein
MFDRFESIEDYELYDKKNVAYVVSSRDDKTEIWKINKIKTYNFCLSTLINKHYSPYFCRHNNLLGRCILCSKVSMNNMLYENSLALCNDCYNVYQCGNFKLLNNEYLPDIFDNIKLAHQNNDHSGTGIDYGKIGAIIYSNNVIIIVYKTIFFNIDTSCDESIYEAYHIVSSNHCSLRKDNLKFIIECIIRTVLTRAMIFREAFLNNGGNYDVAGVIWRMFVDIVLFELKN